MYNVGPAYVIGYAIALVYVWLRVHPNMAYDHLLRNSTTDVSRVQRELDAPSLPSAAHALLIAQFRQAPCPCCFSGDEEVDLNSRLQMLSLVSDDSSPEGIPYAAAAGDAATLRTQLDNHPEQVARYGCRSKAIMSKRCVDSKPPKTQPD